MSFYDYTLNPIGSWNISINIKRAPMKFDSTKQQIYDINENVITRIILCTIYFEIGLI